jgi:hypothetical protein
MTQKCHTKLWKFDNKWLQSLCPEWDGGKAHLLERPGRIFGDVF